MPRQRRLIGPRKQMDISVLRLMSREERLALLIRSVTECGGTLDQDASVTFRELLSQVRSNSRYRDGIL